jgi:predicted RNase H-related nuclease YkuK (DUF458 family)
MSRINAKEISEFLKTVGPDTKIYMGVDSQAFSKTVVDPITKKTKKQWYADYYMVVAVHRNGSNGCKLFYERVTERDYSDDRKKPTYRLMQEAYKTADLYARIKDVIIDYEIEIHLDLNPNKKYASSSVVSQAIGYIKAATNIVPLVKPDSWCSTHAADRLVRTMK